MPNNYNDSYDGGYDWTELERRMAGYTNPTDSTGATDSPKDPTGPTGALDAAIAMARVGLLTPQAAGIIARFSALSDGSRGSHRVVDCHYHRATGRGWVEYRGVTYTPRHFCALVASDTGCDLAAEQAMAGWMALADVTEPTSAQSVASEPPSPDPAPDPMLVETAPIPIRQIVTPSIPPVMPLTPPLSRQSQQPPQPSQPQWQRHAQALELLGGLVVFAVVVVGTLLCASWAAMTLLGQLAVILASGLVDFLAALMGR
jgi:hypothetical protein